MTTPGSDPADRADGAVPSAHNEEDLRAEIADLEQRLDDALLLKREVESQEEIIRLLSHRAELDKAQADRLTVQLREEKARTKQSRRRIRKRWRRNGGSGSNHDVAGGPRDPKSVAASNADADNVAYRKWLGRYRRLGTAERERISTLVAGLDDPSSFTVVMTVRDPDEALLRASIESVCGQLYAGWEFCLVTRSQAVAVVTAVATESGDSRISVAQAPEDRSLTSAANELVAAKSGRFVAFLHPGDVLSPDALALVALAIAARPEAALLYSDEDMVDKNGKRSDPYFKPDWDAVLLLGHNYVGNLCLVRRDVLEAVAGLRTGVEGAEHWDLVFRVTERLSTDQIIHVPHVLYHRRFRPEWTATSQRLTPHASGSARQATAEHLRRTRRTGEVCPVGSTGYQRIRWELPDPPPLVSIVIPTRDGPLLRRCLESLMFRTAYPNYEVIVVDNGSKSQKHLRYLSERVFDVRVLRDDRPFNYSKLNNEAVRLARGSVICLLNDDIEILSEGWLDELVAQLLQPGVGLVGAKLYFPDGSIQHAGVVLGVGGVAGHAFRSAEGLGDCHFGHTLVSRTVSAVTAACMSVRREVWEELGGLDEGLAVAYNDIDFCIRAQRHGWRIVWTPFAELVHSEGTSRGSDREMDNLERFDREHALILDRWPSELKFDPMYNPNLTTLEEDGGLSWPPRIDQSSPLAHEALNGQGGQHAEPDRGN